MRKKNDDERKLEIGEEVIYQDKKTQVISFIPAWNKYLLAGFGSPVKLEEIQVPKGKVSKLSSRKKTKT